MNRYEALVTKQFVKDRNDKIANDDRIGKRIDGNIFTLEKSQYNWDCELFDHAIPLYENCKHIDASYGGLVYVADNKFPDDVLVDNKVADKHGTIYISPKCQERLDEYPNLHIRPIKALRKGWYKNNKTQKWEYHLYEFGDTIPFIAGEIRTAKEIINNLDSKNRYTVKEFQ